MRPEDAVRTLEYSVAPNLGDDSFDRLEAEMYREAFEHVAENGSAREVNELLDALNGEVSDGYRPSPKQANGLARQLLDETPLTDGGE